MFGSLLAPRRYAKIESEIYFDMTAVTTHLNKRSLYDAMEERSKVGQDFQE